MSGRADGRTSGHADERTRGRADVRTGVPASRGRRGPRALLGAVTTVLALGAGIGRPTAAQLPPRADSARLREAQDVLRQLAETYGVSGHEAAVRDAVLRLLPAWADPTVDSAGNVLVRVGHGEPLAVFVAHLDELGFEVTTVRDDGRLDLRARGGFYASLFEGEPALVHTARGPVPGVFALRDSVGPAPRRTPPPLRLDIGTATRAAAEALGVRPGDAVTMPKAFVPLAGARATARSLDDRTGCAAQILALRHLDPRALRRAVVFLWSVREETGLEGARVAAERLAAERPVRVYAVDTFVSSDAPLDPRAFAEAPLGRGPVARAVDNGSVTPPPLLDSLVALARAHHLPLQVGTTNGGNDGSAFTRYGVADVPIGWPGRYSHSPVEVLDLRDLVALSDLIQTIVEHW
jgi:putative aminopeptidase